jgi:hypothetical protein
MRLLRDAVAVVVVVVAAPAASSEESLEPRVGESSAKDPSGKINTSGP